MLNIQSRLISLHLIVLDAGLVIWSLTSNKTLIHETSVCSCRCEYLIEAVSHDLAICTHIYWTIKE